LNNEGNLAINRLKSSMKTGSGADNRTGPGFKNLVQKMLIFDTYLLPLPS